MISRVQGPQCKVFKARRGFTLIELVIVVLVMGIITAVAAPKMFNTATQARESASRQSLTVLRDAIELYRASNSAYPQATTLATNLQPYLQGSFPSPQIGANLNANVATSAASPIATAAGTQGWIYNETTGELRINDAAYITW